MSGIVVIGAGPAGTRAAEVLARAGLRPILIDEAPGSGGRIYQRQPANFRRGRKELYGWEANKARDLHLAMESMRTRVDYRPETLVWNVRTQAGTGGGVLNTLRDGQAQDVPFDQAILCPGAMDRIIPLPGWTLPGVTTLGGAQVALKTQGCAVGRRIAFVGTGPLLWLVAYQHMRAGAEIAAVLDTTGFVAKARHSVGLLRDVRTFAKGFWYAARVALHRTKVVEGVLPQAIEGTDAVTGLRWKGGSVACDAVAMGWGLRPETQLADLAGVPFEWDADQRDWLPRHDRSGRTAVPGILLAGDGARVGGADVAELAGARAAWAVIEDRDGTLDQAEVTRLDAGLSRAAGFRAVLDATFPFPHALAAAVSDDTVLCRCESITAGTLRRAARSGAPEANRAKALTRIGMGRCQGRVCGAPAAEVLADALGCPIEQVGRLRGQPPVRPIPIGAVVAAVAAASAVPDGAGAQGGIVALADG